MTTPDGAERFLQLENSATELLEELEQLNQGTRHYNEAAASMESVESSVKGLTDALTSVSKQLEGVIVGLRDVGLPAVLDRTQSLESELASANIELQSVRRSVQESSSKLEAELTGTRTEIRSLQQSCSEIMTSLEDLGLNLGEKLEENQSSLISRLDSIIRFHSGSIFGKLFGKPDRK